jgi:hypothetical protein
MASQTRLTTRPRSNLGFWLAFGFILWAALTPPPAKSAVPTQAPKSQCFKAISGIPNPAFVPCSFVTPSRYPDQWLTSGVEV